MHKTWLQYLEINNNNNISLLKQHTLTISKEIAFSNEWLFLINIYSELWNE